MKVISYGRGASYVDLELPDGMDWPERTHTIWQRLSQLRPRDEVIPGGGTLVVIGDADPQGLLRDLKAMSADGPLPYDSSKQHTIPVCYDGADLAAVAQFAGLSVADTIAAHHQATYHAWLLGFLPGFSYLGPVSPALALPRRASPRDRVAAGSVAVAGGMTAIYPVASPGGWHLIGHAGARLFDPCRDPPSLLGIADRVRFEPHERVTMPAAEKYPITVTAPTLEVVRAVGWSTIQDGGRSRSLSLGIPPSGALDRYALAVANYAVGNPANAAAIEIVLGAIQLTALRTCTVSIAGRSSQVLQRGDVVSTDASRSAVSYVAVRDGIDVPVLLGSRSTLASVGLGGLDGRILRNGDRLSVGGEQRQLAVDNHDDGPLVPGLLRITPGPHLDRFPKNALDVLTDGPWRIGRAFDRTGTRLQGPAIPRSDSDLALPAPLRRGAVEVTTDGTPIILGPDHPVTGGYPILAVLEPSSQAVLARLRPGDPVSFTAQ
jgi:KipI family sensor histidine kinase inhibitor